jgi:hypothetical protein
LNVSTAVLATVKAERLTAEICDSLSFNLTDIAGSEF